MPALSSAAPRAVEPVAPLGRLERLGVPVGGVTRRLHVVVGVEEHGRRSGRRRPARDDGRGAALDGEDLDVEPLGAEQLGGRLRRAPHVVGVLGEGTHATGCARAPRGRGGRRAARRRRPHAGLPGCGESCPATLDQRQEGTQVGPLAGGAQRPALLRPGPGELTERERDPGRRVGLDDRGWGAALVGRSPDGLRRGVRRDADLDRAARAPSRPAGRGGASTSSRTSASSASPARNRSTAGTTAEGSAGFRRTGMSRSSRLSWRLSTSVSVRLRRRQTPSAFHANECSAVFCNRCYAWGSCVYSGICLCCPALQCPCSGALPWPVWRSRRHFRPHCPPRALTGRPLAPRTR